MIQDGQVEVVDPGLDTLALLRAVNPDFQIESARLRLDGDPGLWRVRRLGCGLSQAGLTAASTESLWLRHGVCIDDLKGGNRTLGLGEEEMSLLALKIELASRLLGDCVLCAHRCHVNRAGGERGVSGLGAEALVAEHFVHVAEEPSINPSLIVSLAGCGLRCRYCQQWPLLDVRALDSPVLESRLWQNLDLRGPRTLSFAGGNPDESVPAVLQFLDAAPESFALPVVWNCHAYSSRETLSLLDGVVDVYLPDLKYFSDDCGTRLSAAPGYPDVARRAVTMLVAQGAAVIVRILILPGHVECCHKPAVRWLENLACKRLTISVRQQYCPDYRTEEERGALGRRPSAEEVSAVLDSLTSGIR